MAQGFTQAQPNMILQGQGVPNIIPSYVGQLYLDQTTATMYIACGTLGSYSWGVFAQGSLNAFNKNTVPNLKGWYDATDLTTITKDGSNNVTAWYDKSDARRNLLLTPATKPLWTANIKNNLPGIFFNGAAYLNGTGLVDLASNTQTLYVVMKPMAWGTGGYQNVVTQLNIGTPVFDFVKNTGTTNIYTFSYNTINGNSGTLIDTTPYIVTIKYNGASGWCKVNNIQTNIITGTAWSGDCVQLILGCSYNATQFYTGYYMEILIFNTALTDNYDAIVRTYLNNKWNIF